MISISHRIELVPNNKQKTYFRKAFGVSRLAYNWGLDEWKRMYEAGEKCSYITLNNKFNAIKREQFPFVLEVTKWAPSQALRNLEKAFKRFFEDLKKGKVAYPQFKHKRDNQGSFYFAEVKLSEVNLNSKAFKNMPHNQKGKRQYLRVPNLGCVKMTERLRFNGKINSVVISQESDRFYASFSMMITEEEYLRTHPHVAKNKKNRSVGVDLGIKSAMVTSDGISIDNPKTLSKYERRIKRVSRALDKRVHARTKQQRLSGVKRSNNYRKLSVTLGNLHRRVYNTRRDFTQKATTILTTNYGRIGMENLNVSGMVKNHRLAKSISDVSFYEIRRQIVYKAAYNGVSVAMSDRFYPSSKTCSACGYVDKNLKLSQRTYRCPECGTVIDRDFNAAINLRRLTEQKVGAGGSELTPADLTALLCLFERNGIATSKVEPGRQQGVCS